MKPTIFVRIPFPPESLALLQQEFTVRYVPTRPEFEDALATSGAEARGIVANGTVGLSADHIAAMPNLEMIHTIGIGYENVDLDACRARGIVVANNAGINFFSVAEHAIGLLLALYRGIPEGDRDVRNGLWDEVRHPRPLIFRKKVGIIGLGEVGLAIAKRIEAFEAMVGYHNRKPRDVPYDYYGSVLDLAEASDVIFIACPGGPETRHLVDAPVIKALGPQGVIINVGRGSVVDEEALVKALHEGALGGAAIDVFDTEPKFPDALAGAPNLIVSPHIAGRSPEAIAFAREQILNNFKAHFAGGQVVHRLV